jgi:hypothetical protein
MSSPKIENYAAHPATVFDAVLDAVESAGYRLHIVSNRRLQLFVSKAGKSWKLAASVTDNGLGEACLHLAWDPTSSKGAAKCAKRIARGVSRMLEEMGAPPPAP